MSVTAETCWGCGHTGSEHDRDTHLCRVRYGALGDSAYLDTFGNTYALCGCNGWKTKAAQ